MSERAPNRLAAETSPYLLQHAHNPVDWYPWGPEALERAEREDKPILLSVGYAACHWCHVMEKESFEDEETAALMNEHFVSVKVDREERPDIDSIYMDAVQAMTGSGGWPMTVFLTPEGEPFYSGTYFPNEDRHGMPAFKRVLAAIADAWRDDRAEVKEQSAKVVRAIEGAAAYSASSESLGEEILLAAHDGLRQAFDSEWGGFGGAPKFPQPMTLEFLLRCNERGLESSLEMVRATLDRMAAGGIHDHIGGGFHRYAVDREWHVPHFEKMLYDNAQLARVYTHAWQVTGEERYRRVATDTLGYLLREMRHPEGGFFSSQDADSEGVEGKFFVWSWDELVEAAGEQKAKALGANPHGNWEGTNVLWDPRGEASLDDGTRAKLLEIRERRAHPATDDKILASWNGLAISALAEAGRIFGEPAYTDAALGAAGFVLTRLRRDDGRLLRAWREGRASGPGYLDDYALVADACLTLYEATSDVGFFREARGLAADILRLFADEERGGFFQTSSDAEALVIRPKELYDNAVPSGNSAAAVALQRLALLTGDAQLEEAAASALGLVRDAMAHHPAGFGLALSALDFHVAPVREIAVVGDPAGAEPLVEEVWGRYLPNHVLAVGEPGSNEVELLRGRPLVDGKAAAYVCRRFVCGRPVTEAAELAAQLS